MAHIENGSGFGEVSDAFLALRFPIDHRRHGSLGDGLGVLINDVECGNRIRDEGVGQMRA